MIELGAYKVGTNKRTDRAIELVPRIGFSKQPVHEVRSRQAIRALAELIGPKSNESHAFQVIHLLQRQAQLQREQMADEQANF